jgi:tetratricopeptide (TPR) repeat protein
VTAAVLITAGRRAWSGASAPPPEISPADRAAFEQHMAAAGQAFLAERHAEAFAALTRAAERAPRDPAPRHALGEVYEKLAMKEIAETCFRQALALDPDYWPATESLIKTLHDLGKPREALAVIAEARKKRPEEPFLWAEEALGRLRLGQAAEAVALFEKYNAAVGKQAWGYAHLARAHSESGDLDTAEKYYRDALALDPRLAIAHFWYGQLLIARGQGRKDAAEAALATYRKLRDLETRVQSLELALLGRPAEVRLLVELAQARFELGKGPAALAALEKALALAPGDERLQKLHAGVKQAVERGRGGAAPSPDGPPTAR